MRTRTCVHVRVRACMCARTHTCTRTRTRACGWRALLVWIVLPRRWLERKLVMLVTQAAILVARPSGHSKLVMPVNTPEIWSFNAPPQCSFKAHAQRDRRLAAGKSLPHLAKQTQVAKLLKDSLDLTAKRKSCFHTVLKRVLMLCSFKPC